MPRSLASAVGFPLRRALFALLLPLTLLRGETPAPAVTGADDKAKAPGEFEFVRFVEDKNSARLETSVCSYVNQSGTVVDLIGAVHIGDKAYFQGFNALFPTYDALLFEMVGGRNGMTKEDMEGKGRGFNFIRGLQQGMGQLLDLSYQLQEVDYTAKNFVHADMAARQFADRQKARGEGFLQMFLRSWQNGMEKQIRDNLKADNTPAPPMPSLLQIIELAAKGKAAPFLKLMMGKQMSHMEDITGAVEGPEGSVILTERNAFAFTVLEKQLAKGVKKIGIFYGAAHLPDMEKRLLALGFKRLDHFWLTAWFIPQKDLQWKK